MSCYLYRVILEERPSVRVLASAVGDWLQPVVILGWISRRWDVGMWTGLGWPRIGTGGGRL